VIVCLRTVDVPAHLRKRYLSWIDEGRDIRQAHGILAELVCEPSAGVGETVVITVWPDHETFDTWSARSQSAAGPTMPVRWRITRAATRAKTMAMTATVVQLTAVADSWSSSRSGWVGSSMARSSVRWGWSGVPCGGDADAGGGDGGAVGDEDGGGGEG
jgi:hypothetical protein